MRSVLLGVVLGLGFIQCLGCAQPSLSWYLERPPTTGDLVHVPIDHTAPRVVDPSRDRGTDHRHPFLAEQRRVTGSVWCVDFAADGSLLSGDDSGVIQSWSPDGIARTNALHNKKIIHLEADPSGPRFATTSRDGTVRVWSLETWRQILEVPLGDEATSTAFHPAGNLLATTRMGPAGSTPRKTIHLWSLTTGKLERALLPTASATRVSFSPDGRFLSASLLENEPSCWAPVEDPDRGIRALGSVGLWTIDVDFGEVDDLLVLGVARSPSFQEAGSGYLDVRDAVSGESRRRIELESAPVSMDFAPGSSVLAVAIPDRRKVELWNVTTGVRIAEIPAPYPVTVAFSPDGTLLAVSSPIEESIDLWSFAPEAPPSQP